MGSAAASGKPSRVSSSKPKTSSLESVSRDYIYCDFQSKQ